MQWRHHRGRHECRHASHESSTALAGGQSYNLFVVVGVVNPVVIVVKAAVAGGASVRRLEGFVCVACAAVNHSDGDALSLRHRPSSIGGNLRNCEGHNVEQQHHWHIKQ